MTNHGVLSDGKLLQVDKRNNSWIEEVLACPQTLAGLCELAEKKKLSHLWVMRDNGLLPDKAFYEASVEEWSTVHSWQFPQDFPLPEGVINQLIQVTGRSRRVDPNRSSNPRVSVCFGYNSHWDFMRIPDLSARDQLRVIGYLEKALGVTVGAGPSTVGTKVLEMVLAPYPDWLTVPESDLRELHFTIDAAKNVIWDRPPSELDLQKKYVVKVDKNSAFPRGCVEEAVGSGMPELVDGSRYAHKYPGVWRISVQGEDRTDLPAPLWSGAEWVATPIVKLLMKMGYQVQVHEGWAFCREEKVGAKTVRNYHGILKNWAEYLWNARKQFLDADLWRHPRARELARGAVKDIMNMTIGLYSYGGFAVLCYAARPDWNVQIVASARAAMFYNMLKFEQEGHGTPVIVYIDALLYCTDDPTSFPDNRTSLGGYKHEWTLELTDEVKEILSAKRSRAKKLERLNALAETQSVKIVREVVEI